MTNEELTTGLRHIAHTMERNGHSYYQHVAEGAIKALEQEDVLDKIKAEIERAADKQFQIAMGVSDLNERYAHIQMENAYRHSLNVIDKYKAESEDEE